VARIDSTKFLGPNSVDESDIRLNNNSYLRARNSTNNADVDLIKLRSDNLVQLGNGSLIISEGNFAPFDSNVYSCGAAFRFWSNVYTFGIVSPYFIANQFTSPSGNLVSGLQTSNVVTAGLLTDNRNEANSNDTTPIRLETGNILNASSTGDSGGVFIKTGNTDGSGGGDSGDIGLETGTSAGGVRGRCIVDARTFRLPRHTSAPTANEAGEMYYNTTTDKSYTWDGSAWQAHF
jgi:hypothetical protein